MSRFRSGLAPAVIALALAATPLRAQGDAAVADMVIDARTRSAVIDGVLAA